MVRLSKDKERIKRKVLEEIVKRSPDGTMTPKKETDERSSNDGPEALNEISSIRHGGRRAKAHKNPLPLVFRDGIFQYRRDDIYIFTNEGIFPRV